MIRSGFALASTFEFALAIAVIVISAAGYYAPEIGMFIFNITDFQ